MNSLGLLQAFSGLKMGLASIATLVFILVCAGFFAGSKQSNKISYLLLLLVSVIWVFIAGAYTGSLSSNSINIPWYAFGIVISLVCFSIGFLVIYFWPEEYGSAQAFLSPPPLTLTGMIAINLMMLAIAYALVNYNMLASVGVPFYILHIAFNLMFIVLAFGFRKARSWSLYSLLVLVVIYIVTIVLYTTLLKVGVNEWTIYKFAYTTIIPVVIMLVGYIQWRILLRRCAANAAAH